MGAAAVLMMGAGAVNSAVGSYYQSKASKSSFAYQAEVAENNAQYGEWQAQDVLRRAQWAENQSRHRTAQLKGTQRAVMAARNIALDEGSALNILSDTDFMGELDALAIRDNAAKEAWGIREAAKSASANSILLQGRSAAESPFASATGSLLTNAGSVASAWYRYTESK